MPPSAPRLADQPVHPGEYAVRPGVVERQRPQGGPHLPHPRRCLHVVPGDIAQHDAETAVGQHESVVEVAAGGVAVHPGLVARRDPQLRQVRQVLRQHAALQQLGGAVLGLEAAGPLGGLRDQLGAGGKQRPLRRGPGVRIAVPDPEGAPQGCRPQRQRRQRPDLLVVPVDCAGVQRVFVAGEPRVGGAGGDGQRAGVLGRPAPPQRRQPLVGLVDDLAADPAYRPPARPVVNAERGPVGVEGVQRVAQRDAGDVVEGQGGGEGGGQLAQALQLLDHLGGLGGDGEHADHPAGAVAHRRVAVREDAVLDQTGARRGRPAGSSPAPGAVGRRGRRRRGRRPVPTGARSRSGPRSQPGRTPPGAARRPAGRRRRCRSAPGRRRRRAPSASGRRRPVRPTCAAPDPSCAAHRAASAPMGTRRVERRCPWRLGHRRRGPVGWGFGRTCLACQQPNARPHAGMDDRHPECHRAFARRVPLR